MSEVNAKQFESMSIRPSRGGLGLTSLSLLALAWGTACVGDTRSRVEDPGMGAVPMADGVDALGSSGTGVAGDASQPPPAAMADGSEDLMNGAEQAGGDPAAPVQDSAPAAQPEPQAPSNSTDGQGGVPPAPAPAFPADTIVPFLYPTLTFIEVS